MAAAAHERLRGAEAEVHLTRPLRWPFGRGDVLTALAIAFVVAVVLRRALLLGEVIFRRDVHLMWYAQAEAMVRAVGHGEWPLWNPDIGFGQPLWADANVQVLYPTTWLNLLVRPWTYYTAYAVLHLATGRVREVHPLLYLVAAAFLVDFLAPLARG